MKRMLVGSCLAVLLVSPLTSPPAAPPPFLLMWGSAGDGPGQFDPTYGPRAVDLDDYGNVYVVDHASGVGNRVQVFNTNGRYLRHFVAAYDNGQVRDIILDGDGNIFLVNFMAARIEKYDSKGTFLFVAGWGVAGGSGFEICTSSCTGGIEGGGDGQLNYPSGGGTDVDGNLYVADSWNDRLVKYDGSGNFLLTWGWGVDDGTAGLQVCTTSCQAGIAGSGAGQFDNPEDVVVRGNTVYVADRFNSRVQLFNRTGGLLGEIFVNQYVGHVDVSSEGDVYAPIANLNKIFQIDNSGVEVASWGVGGSGIGEFNLPDGIVVAPNGDVFVTDGGNNRVQKFGPPLKSFRAGLLRKPAHRIVSPR
jgi:hypothetical protein